MLIPCNRLPRRRPPRLLRALLRWKAARTRAKEARQLRGVVWAEHASRRARAANEAPMIAALPLGRTIAPAPVSPAEPPNPADAASTIVSTPVVADPDETPAQAAKKVRKPSRKNGGHGVSRDRRWRDDQWSARAYALPDNRYLRSPYEWSWGRSW